MEKIQRSRSHHRRHHSAATFSKKLSEVHSFNRKEAYDDDRHSGGHPKLGATTTVSSRVEDYYEIFNSSRASRGTSIPVLDLPDVKERQGPGRVRSSEIDYSKIFGGLNDANFAGTYDELFAEPKGEESSSDEAWTPAETGSPSEDSDSLYSYEASHQPFDAKKKFNLSYHKTNLRSRDGTSGTTHIAQLHAVPGFTFVIDEETPLRSTKENEIVPPKISDATVSNFSGEIVNGKHCRRAAPDFPNRKANRATSEGDVKFHSGSRANNILLDPHETSLKKHPSNGAPVLDILLNLDNNRGDSYRSMPPNIDISKSACVSPPFSDEEVDTNSAAAASAIALRKAIAEAQARIRIAKESLERKSRGFDNSFKSSFKDSLKAKEKNKGKIAAKAQVLNEKPRENCEIVDIAGQVFDGMERPNARKTVHIAPNFRDGIEFFLAKEAPEGTNDKDCKSVLADHRLDGAGEQEAVKQCHELAMAGKPKAATLVFKQADSKKKLVQSMDECEQKEKKITKKPFHKPLGSSRKIKAAVAAHELERTEQDLCADPRTKNWEEYVENLNPGHGLNEQIENKKKLKVFPEQEEPEENLTASHARKKIQEKLDNCPEPDHAKEFEVQHWEEIKNESTLKEGQEKIEYEKPGVAHEQEEIQKGSEEVTICEEHEENLQEIHEYEEIDKKLKEGCKCGEGCEEKQKEASGWEENTELNYTFEKEDNDRGLQGVLRQEVDENKLSDACEESVKRLEEDCEWVRNAKFEEPLMHEENEKILPSDDHDDKESDNRLEEDCEWERNAKFEESQMHEENEKIPEMTYLMEEYDEMLKENPQEWEETYGMWTETCRSEENVNERCTDHEEKGNMMNSVQDTSKHEENIKVDNDACDWDENGNLAHIQESCTDRENVKNLEAAFQTAAHDETWRVVEGTKASCEPEYSEEFKAVNVENMLDEGEEFLRVGLAQADLKYDDIMKEGASEALVFHRVDLKEANMNFEANQIDWNTNQHASACDLKEPVETLPHELGNNVSHAREAEVSFDHEVDDNDFRAIDGNMIENEKDIGTTQLPCTFDNDKEIMKKDETERSQTTEKGEKSTVETTAREETETKKVLEKELQLDEKDLIKMNEQKVKEREREKGRIAVDRAIREARERAFAEARERAERAAVERATAEARERVKAKAQERFEKASVQAKSLAEKGSEGAKLKVQRAAVERATAEARERALQKAMSEKAAFDGREQADRFSTKKFSGVSKDNGVKQRFPSYDPKFQGSGPSSSSKYSNSANHGASNATEKFDGAKADPALRCQAKLERHQRTVERAAKALAEKNMRDLLAQKEQVERNRLAEGLDADVKRWSSGKQGNLRALLSTLQYILGPDSGWQAIPLTDIVTAVSVKKAYRKAALCVHPDKLQQRGATIQQKYICEKVFDLLKAAWNRFNSEER